MLSSTHSSVGTDETNFACAKDKHNETDEKTNKRRNSPGDGVVDLDWGVTSEVAKLAKVWSLSNLRNTLHQQQERQGRDTGCSKN